MRPAVSQAVRPPLLRVGPSFIRAVGSQPRNNRSPGPLPDQATLASMGPWLRSHGRIGGAGTGKTTMMLQLGRGFVATEGTPAQAARLRRCVLQWGRGFVATEGRRLWLTSRPTTCFNGAVAS